METLSLQTEKTESRAAGIQVPAYLYAAVLSSLSIIIGLIWDISWHMSIGRDGLFSPPHLAIYLGGITAGLFSGYRVLKITLAGSLQERVGSVKFWGKFYGSLGNLFCIWGAIAMLTSAPFDDWWHNTYGLDVTILSPPHTVLLLGMITIQLGAMISVLSYLNNYAEAHKGDQQASGKFELLFALSSGFMLIMVHTIFAEYLDRHEMHGARFYVIASFVFPLFLIASSVTSPSKWGATRQALVYSIIMALLVWILPLFPATPKLGPVLYQLTTFQPFDFPLLLLFPALVIDWIVHRPALRNKWIMAIICGVAFLLVFTTLQWPFANAIMASGEHWIFGAGQMIFSSDPTWEYRFGFSPRKVTSGADHIQGMAIALLLAILSSRTGLSWGNWMKKIVR